MHFCHNENKLKIDKNSLPGNPSSIRAMGPKWATRGRCVPIPGSSTASAFLPRSRSWSFLEGAKSRRVLEKVRALSSLTRLDQPQSCTRLQPQSPHCWLWPWSFSGSLPLCWRHADSWTKGEVPPRLASFPTGLQTAQRLEKRETGVPCPRVPKDERTPQQKWVRDLLSQAKAPQGHPGLGFFQLSCLFPPWALDSLSIQSGMTLGRTEKLNDIPDAYKTFSK